MHSHIGSHRSRYERPAGLSAGVCSSRPTWLLSCSTIRSLATRALCAARRSAPYTHQPQRQSVALPT